MGSKLYIGNLSWTATEEDLQKFFSQYGSVAKATIVREKTEDGPGRSRGFAFVEMGSESEARDAIEASNEKEFMGRTLKVNEAVERKREPSGGDRGGYKGKRRDY